MTDLKPVRAWRAYYAPDRWVCSTNGIAPENLEDGVQVIIAFEREDYAPGKPYRRIILGSDWYFWAGEYVGSLSDFVREKDTQREGEWADPQPILDVFPDAVLKKGVTIGDDEFERTRVKARKVESIRWQ